MLAVANLGPGSQKYFSQLFISSMDISNQTIAIIGLGYVGLPLAVEFGKVQLVIGFDINEARIRELQGGQDRTLKCSLEKMAQASLAQRGLRKKAQECANWHWTWFGQA